jgi:hypothetical protein
LQGAQAKIQISNFNTCGWLIPWVMGWSCFPSPGAKQLFATKEYKEHKEKAEFLTADGTGWARIRNRDRESSEL